MASGNWFGRLRGIDIRLVAAIGATLLLIFAIAVTLPNGPDSGNVIFDPAPRHDISHAERVELAKPIESRIMRDKDADFYQVKSAGASGFLTVHVNNESKTFIPEVRVFDINRKSNGESHADAPGANLEYRFPAQPDTTYYIQVWGQQGTVGTYILMVSVVS